MTRARRLSCPEERRLSKRDIGRVANTRPRVSEEATLDSTRHLPAPSRILGRLWSALWPEAPLNQRSQPEKNKSSHYSRVPGNMDREMMKKKKEKEEEEEERKGWEGKGEEPALSICLVADEITFCNSTVRRRILIPAINLVGSPRIPGPSRSCLPPPPLYPLSLFVALFSSQSGRRRKFKGERKRERESMSSVEKNFRLWKIIGVKIRLKYRSSRHRTTNGL